MFYTDVFTERSKVYVRGYYEDGTRLHQTYDYQPYLFEENEAGEYRTLSGIPVSKVHFDTIKQAKDYVKQYEDVHNAPVLYGMTDFIYPFIFDTFGPDPVQYDASMVRVGSIDVEVESDKGFPEPATASFPVTAITVGNRKLQVTLGLKPYTKGTAPNHKYILCKSESDLFYKFLEVWKHLDFDVITGWNIEKFDIPYIVRRGWQVVGEEAMKALSPWHRVYEKEVFDAQFEETSITYQIRGIATLDYMVLYKKFSYSPQESYRLDHIAYVELDQRKLDYSEYESLNELYEKDHDKFIDYNLRDNVLIFSLDDKMGFINQVMAIAYDSMINYADALTSVKMWEVIAHNHLLRKGVVSPPRNRKKKGRRILGGYVKEPWKGRFPWVVSYDFTSLYPHLIMMFNISPETMLSHRILELYRPSSCVDQLMDGGLNEELLARLKAYDATLVPLGIMYTNSRVGFFPELMDTMYKDRKMWKDRELEYTSELVRVEDEMKRRGMDV